MIYLNLAKNHTTNYSYNDKQQLVSIISGKQSVSYDYNKSNLISKIKFGNKEYNFNYDDFLNINDISVGNNITLVKNEYEANNGKLCKTIYGNNNEIKFEYDEFDRIKTKYYMDDIYNFKYDNNGNINKILSNKYIEKFIYDNKKRIQKYIFDNFKINYEYSSDDVETVKYYKLNDKTSKIENSFDDNNLLIKTAIDDKVFNYQYDVLGRLITKKINGNFNVEYKYVTKGKRTSEIIRSIKNGDDKYSYGYDKLNNITHIYHDGILTKQYYYDENNQLIGEENFETQIKVSYDYDKSGNILTKTTIDMKSNNIISTNSYSYENPNWEDQLTRFNNDEIVYDNIGNTLSIGNNISMNWINGIYLSNYNDASKNLNATYNYNEDGSRISKIVNNKKTNYYLEDDSIIFEETEDKIINYLYDLTGISGLSYNGNTYYYLKNLQGDVIGILNSNFDKIVNYEYDSWGNILSVKDALGNEITDINNVGLINPFRYRGYYYDVESELYYVSKRYYNPKTGRWISPESNIYEGEFDDNAEILGHNLYVYCANNPIMYKDESGEGLILACVLVCATIGTVAGGVYGSKKAKKKGYKPSDGWNYWKYVVGFGVVGGVVGALVGYGASALISKYGVTKAATSITKGGGARFSSYSALKKSMGSAGVGKEWHHIVEQCQAAKSGFSTYWINNSNNVIQLSKSVHTKISKYYNSRQSFTHGLKFRDWLAGKDFKTQYEWGIKILRMFGVKI